VRQAQALQVRGREAGGEALVADDDDRRVRVRLGDLPVAGRVQAPFQVDAFDRDRARDFAFLRAVRVGTDVHDQGAFAL
jgi:hypothetical protein